MRILLGILCLTYTSFLLAGANCPTVSVGVSIEKYPYPDSQGYYAALNYFTDTNGNGTLEAGTGDDPHFIDSNMNGTPDGGEIAVTMNQGCAIMGFCPANYSGILLNKYQQEAADSTCTTMVDASARTLTINQFSYSKTSKTCTISSFASDFSACEKMFWHLCRKEAAEHTCFSDADFVGSESSKGVFPTHVLTAYSYIYNYGHSPGGGGGGGKGGGGGNKCKIEGGVWTCN